LSLTMSALTIPVMIFPVTCVTCRRLHPKDTTNHLARASAA
jgi:uncharacterized membrane protein YhaH (DUF805 family)